MAVHLRRIVIIAVVFVKLYLPFGLQPFDWRTMQVGLSPEAEAMLPVFAEKVVAELARRGIVARRKETA